MTMHSWIDGELKKRGRNAAAELGRALALSPEKISRMRKGERRPTAEELPKLEAFFGTKAPLRSSLAVIERGSEQIREEWIENNIRRGAHLQQAHQQEILEYLTYYTSEIAFQLARIATELERIRDRNLSGTGSGQENQR